MLYHMGQYHRPMWTLSLSELRVVKRRLQGILRVIPLEESV